MAALGSALLLLFAARTSGADTAGDVYSDVRELLTELMQQRASEDAASFVRRSSAGLGFYLNRSLENVRRGQWGALHDSLRDDFADLSGDYVFWELRNADDLYSKAGARKASIGAGDRAATFKIFLGCFELPLGRARPECAQLQALARRPRVFSQVTLLYEQCTAAEPEKKEGMEFSCDVAQLVRAAFLNDADAAHSRAVRVLSAAGAFLLPCTASAAEDSDHKSQKGGQPLRDLLQATLDPAPGASNDTAIWPAAAAPTRVLADALSRCKTDRSIESLVHSAAVDGEELLRSPNESRLSAAAACLNARVPLPLSAKIRRYEQPEQTLELAESALRSALLAKSKNPIMAAFAANEQRTGLSLEIGGFRCETDQQVCTWDEGKVQLKVDSRELGLALLSLNRLNDRVFERSPIHEGSRCTGTCPFEIFELTALFGAVHEQSPAAEPRTVANVADEVERALAVIAKYRNDDWHHRPVLRRVALLSPKEGWPEYDADLREILQASLRGDRARLATFALRAAFDDMFQSGGTNRFDGLFADLVVSMTQFELQNPGQDADAVARDALHAAGIRLIDGLASQQGFQRQGLTLRPVATLRASWNQGYRNARGSNGLRYVPSLDWPVERVRISEATAVQLTVFDLLAPLAELASREQVQYAHEDLLLLDVLRPRLNLLIGYPALSRNIVGSVGLGFRMITVVPLDAQRDDYRTTVHFQQQLPQALEVNLGVSYVF